MQKKIFTPAFNKQLLEDLQNSIVLKDKLASAIRAVAKDKSMQEIIQKRRG